MQSIEEIILQDIKTTLDSAEGFTSGTVFRFSQMGHAYETVPCIDIVFDKTFLLKQINNLSEYEMTVFINVIARDESANTDAYMDALLYSIRKALMRDPGRGGHARSTEIKRIETGLIVTGQPEVERLITLSIIYRIQTKNPEKN